MKKGITKKPRWKKGKPAFTQVGDDLEPTHDMFYRRIGKIVYFRFVSREKKERFTLTLPLPPKKAK